MVNAGETKEQKVNGDCVEIAIEFFYEATESGMDYEDANELADSLQSICEALTLVARYL